MRLDQRDNPKLMWMIAGGLVVVILIIAVFFWLNGSTENTPINKSNNPVAPTQTKTEVAPPPVAQPVEQASASALTNSESSNIELVNESLLKEKVPENATLAKEEIAKLDDVQKQLGEQHQSLKSQHTDADQLIKLKEEQIKLLEQQLAENS